MHPTAPSPLLARTASDYAQLPDATLTDALAAFVAVCAVVLILYSLLLLWHGVRGTPLPTGVATPDRGVR